MIAIIRKPSIMDWWKQMERYMAKHLGNTVEDGEEGFYEGGGGGVKVITKGPTTWTHKSSKALDWKLGSLQETALSPQQVCDSYKTWHTCGTPSSRSRVCPYCFGSLSGIYSSYCVPVQVLTLGWGCELSLTSP